MGPTFRPSRKLNPLLFLGFKPESFVSAESGRSGHSLVAMTIDYLTNRDPAATYLLESIYAKRLKVRKNQSGGDGVFSGFDWPVLLSRRKQMHKHTHDTLNFEFHDKGAWKQNRIFQQL